MRLPLSLKLLLRIGIAVCFCIFLLGIFEFYQSKLTLYGHLEDTAKQVATRLGRSLVVPLWNINRAAVETIVETEMLDRDVYAVTVKDVQVDEYIVTKSRGEGWSIADTTDPETLEAPLVSTASIMQNDKHLGEVRVYLSDRYTKALLIESVTDLAVRLFILFLLITAALIIFINRLISTPLSKLNKSCEKMAHGDFGIELETRRNDEIGSLARSFTLMRDAIKEKITVLNTEIRQREQREEEIDRLRTFLNNIVDSMPSLLISVDNSFRINQWNREAEKVTTVTKQSALGKSLIAVLPCLTGIVDAIKTAIRKGTTQTVFRIALSLAEEERICDVTIYPLTSASSSGAVIRLDDITDRVKLEEVMVQTEKMKSVGGLAAGMAHEINNPLAGIMQAVQVVQNRFSLDLDKNKKVADRCKLTMESLNCYLQERDILPMLQSIHDSGERASRIISNMLSFSRKRASSNNPCDINALLERTLELATNDYDLKKNFDFRNIHIVREFDEKLPDVRCDPNTIQQVFFNLLKNAAQAISAVADSEQGWDNGLSSGRRIPEIILRTYQANGYVKIDIQDNGVGMKEEVRKRIFEPFFTTKHVGVGTGLGLSVSFFIVKENHRGEIEVFSTPEGGTTFIVSLPL